MRIVIILLMLLFMKGSAQVSKDSKLFKELKKQDSIFFERSFNLCDSTYTKKAVSDGLRFYHDQSGFQDKAQFLDNTRKYLCSNPDKKPIRKLVEGSLEVFPLYENGVLYGAIQQGLHEFYIREPQKYDVKTGMARFIAVWILKEQDWILEEVLSYDHKPVSEN